MSLFDFPLTAEDERRNEELLRKYLDYNKVIFGGIVLAVQNFEPRKTTFEIDNKSWFTKIDAGITTEISRTFRNNADGTRTETVVTRTINNDGSVTTKTKEATSAQSNKVRTQSTNTNIPLVNPSSAGFGQSNSPHYDRIVEVKNITSTQEKGSQTTYNTVETITNPEDPKTRSRHVKRFTDEQYPIAKAKPVIIRTITGKEYTQYIQPAPPQGQDQTYWNEDMFNVEETENVEITDNGDGTETEIKTEQVLNADGFLKEVITETTTEKETESDDNTVETKIVKDPIKEVVTEILFDRDGAEASRKTTTTTKISKDGSAPSTKKEICVNTTDNFGKTTQKITTSIFDPLTALETIEEIEEILDQGEDKITYTRNIDKDFNTGKETVQETITTTDGYGNTTTETQTTERGFSTVNETTERVTEAKNDAIVDDIVNGFIVTEYVISGDLITIDQANKIKNKYEDHQFAWGFLKVKEEQLALGDQLSPAKRKELYRQWQEVFYADPDQKVMGGKGLDRIRLYAFGEQDIPVVFAPSADSFKVDYIAGAYGLYSWSMVVRSYKRIVRDKDNTYKQQIAGGRFGRSDAKHWINNDLPDTLENEIQDRKDVEEGGSWQFN